jgi:nitrate reductase gamma subunit
MNVLLSLLGVLLLAGLAWVGVEKLHAQVLFGIVLPYLAVVLFLGGLVARVMGWARSHVPFRIPTTCGQQRSLPWIKSSTFDSPHNRWGVVVRMALEILFFRSLFRNTRAELKEGGKLVHGPTKWLWLAALAFHYSFLIVFIRHLRFFTHPVPKPIEWLGALDGFFQVGLPVLYVTDLLLLGAVSYLLLRRLVVPQVRYVSLATDYFPLFLIGGVAVSGVLMRYFFKVDVPGVKALALGLVSLQPVVPGPGVGSIFYVHLFLVSALIAYFPFSKLCHMAGVFLSPTRNLANNNRALRHAASWPVEVRERVYPRWKLVHTYAEYEDEFRDKMKAVGLPLEREAGEASRGGGEGGSTHG